MNIYKYLKVKSMNFISTNVTLEESQSEIIQYGIEVLLINLFKSFILFLAACFLGIFKEVLMFFICFAFLRFSASGVHASSGILCNIINFLIFIGGCYLSIYLPLPLPYLVLFFILSLLLVYLYAPADTRKKPIESRKLRQKLKTKALLSTTILFLIMLNMHSNIYKNIITYAVLSEALCLTPIIYKILGEEYHYYENHQNFT